MTGAGMSDPGLGADLRPCHGCGALVPETGGFTHRYIGASPGCWAVYGEVLAKEYGDLRYWRSHQLTVDAYAAQHPGEPSPQSVQSVAVHLIGLYLQLERGLRPEEIIRARKRTASRKRDLVWLEPPVLAGDLTVLDVRDAGDPDEHGRLVRLWARSVWQAWAPRHDTVRRWAEG